MITIFYPLPIGADQFCQWLTELSEATQIRFDNGGLLRSYDYGLSTFFLMPSIRSIPFELDGYSVEKWCIQGRMAEYRLEGSNNPDSVILLPLWEQDEEYRFEIAERLGLHLIGEMSVEIHRRIHDINIKRPTIGTMDDRLFGDTAR